MIRYECMESRWVEAQMVLMDSAVRHRGFQCPEYGKSEVLLVTIGHLLCARPAARNIFSFFINTL